MLGVYVLAPGIVHIHCGFSFTEARICKPSTSTCVLVTCVTVSSPAQTPIDFSVPTSMLLQGTYSLKIPVN